MSLAFVKRLWSRDRESSGNAAETYLKHVTAGDAFNSVVMDENLGSYFSDALAKLDLADTGENSAQAHEFKYVVPGKLPKDRLDRVIYDIIFQRVEEDDDLTRRQANLVLLLSLVLGQPLSDRSDLTEAQSHAV